MYLEVAYTAPASVALHQQLTAGSALQSGSWRKTIPADWIILSHCTCFAASRLLGLRVWIPPGLGYLFVVQVEVSAKGRSLVQGSHAGFVCVCVIRCNNNPQHQQWLGRRGQAKNERNKVTARVMVAYRFKVRSTADVGLEASVFVTVIEKCQCTVSLLSVYCQFIVSVLSVYCQCTVHLLSVYCSCTVSVLSVLSVYCQCTVSVLSV